MLNFTQGDLKNTAERVPEMHPDPVPRFRLLRDVLGLDAAYQSAREDRKKSRWIALLESSQLADGTWGIFHTRDIRVKQRFATTELALSVALDCGLDKQGPVLQRVQPTILDHMEGKYIWPDRPEKHDNPLAWSVLVRHISAATLARIDTCHPRLGEFWLLWAEALKAAFHSGEYDRQREIAALNSLMKCRMQDPMPFHKRYPLLILSAINNQLSRDLERMMLEWVLHSPSGIYYLLGLTQ